MLQSQRREQEATLLVVLLDVRRVEADYVDCVARVSRVCQEGDAFAGADGAESLGDDVGVAEGAGRAGFVVSDEVGAETAIGAAAGGLAVGDAAESLATPGSAFRLGRRPPRGHVSRGDHVRSWTQRKPTALLAPRRR